MANQGQCQSQVSQHQQICLHHSSSLHTHHRSVSMSTMPTPPGGDGNSPATHMPGLVSEQAQLRAGCGAGRPVPRKLHLPEPSQDRQGRIAGSVEQGHLAPAQPLTRHCSWREPDKTDSPRFASHLSSNPLGLTSQMYHRKMRRPDIVKRCLIIWTVSWNKL